MDPITKFTRLDSDVDYDDYATLEVRRGMANSVQGSARRDLEITEVNLQIYGSLVVSVLLYGTDLDPVQDV